MIRRPPRSTLFPTRRSSDLRLPPDCPVPVAIVLHMPVGYTEMYASKLDELSPLSVTEAKEGDEVIAGDRKSTRLNSSHSQISYAVFCLKKKKKQINHNNERI